MNNIIAFVLSVSMLFTVSSCKSHMRVRDHAAEGNISPQVNVKADKEVSERTDPYKEDNMKRVIKISANGNSLYANLEDNSSADALFSMLKEAPLTVEMSDFGSFEKVGSIGKTLPRNDTQITTRPGDIILYQGNQITIYYDVNTWNFTLLGHIDIEQEELMQFLGEGDVTVTFSVD